MSNALSLRTPKYRRHKAKGLAVVTINGRDHYLGKYDSAASHEAYRRIVGEYLQTGTGPSDAEQHTITVVEVLAAYKRFAGVYYRKNGKLTREYEKAVRVAKAVQTLYGRTPATDFGPLALKAVRQTFIDAGQSRKVVNKHVEIARRMFRWAAAEELIPASIPQALAMVPGLKKGRCDAPEKSPVRPIDDASVDVILDKLPAIVADMVRLQRATGMRPIELCILRPCDIDRAGDVWLYTPESHKTEHHGRERVVFIGPKGQEVLLRYLARDAGAYCFQPRDSEAKRLAARSADRKTPLSCGNRPGTNRIRRPKRQAGKCYTTCTYRQAIYRGCDKAGIDRWSPNQLRHSAATEIRREFGLEASQVILGHANATVTQVYAERDIAKGIEVAKLIG